MIEMSFRGFTVFIVASIFLLALSACSPNQLQTSQAIETYRYAQTTIKAAAISSDGMLSLLSLIHISEPTRPY